MFKKIGLAASLLASAALGGCAVGQEVENLFSPNPTVAAAALAQLTTQSVVVLCDISKIAAVAAPVEAAAQAGVSITGTTSKVLAASSAACTGIGALVLGTVSAPAGTTVIQ